MGKTLLNADYIIDEDNPCYICFGDHTRTFNVVKNDFCVMDNVKVLRCKNKYNINSILFILSSWKKDIRDLGYSRHWKLAKDSKILLPTKNGKIDFDFMESFISELDAQRITELEKQSIAELEAYLNVAGFENYELTDEEQIALNKYNSIVWAEYKLKDLFDVNSYKKRFDANKINILDNGKHPYVVRTAYNNGIRGYINEDEQYLNPGNTISFGQDTATMWYQEIPYFTGDKIKILESKFEEFRKENAHFMITAMSKPFQKFSWGASSFSVKIIKSQKVKLPVNNNGGIDFTYMETLSQAIKKLVIRDVVLYADQKIAATKKVINKNKNN